MITFENITSFALTFAVSAILFGQEPLNEDTIQFMPERNLSHESEVMRTMRIEDIEIIALPIKPLPYFSLSKEDISELSMDDIGTVLTKLSGTAVKSYGGLGGLKTVSIRGMGAEHTATVVDGFNLGNAQSGLMNYSQLQTDGIQSIVLKNGISDQLMVPVSGRLGAGAVSISTFQNSHNVNRSSFNANAKYGSFGRVEGYVSGLKQLGKGVSIYAFGKYRTANGEYPYSFLNGLTPTNEQRQNNDYEDIYYGLQLQYNPRYNTKFRLGYKGAYIDQGLPGAVILYNETADERLNTIDHLVYVDGTLDKNQKLYRLYGSFNQNDLDYLDPTFLNDAGMVADNYINRQSTVGLTYEGFNFKKFYVTGGIEEVLSTLDANSDAIDNPWRSHLSGVFTAHQKTKIGEFKGQLAAQFVAENTQNKLNPNALFRVNPALEYESRRHGKWQFRHFLWYKNTLRMPSFNELYYTEIGNTDLLPETANQISYGVYFAPKQWGEKSINIRTNIYYNRVANKIVAIPTKNLFIWSTQNVTDVSIYGGEIGLDMSWDFRAKNGYPWILKLMANYTYQKAIDVTEGSLNYKDQIAYTPEHMSNFDVALKKKWFGLRISNNYTGLRYALNENVTQNIVDAYLTTDIAAHYQFHLKNDNTLRLQTNVNNIFNVSYAYVRSFVMPGRNFIISLSYAL